VLRSLVLAILLFTHPHLAVGDSDTSITIAPARTRVVSNRTDLAKACATGDRIFACTAFAGEKLTCSCERQQNTWRVHAEAQFIPYIYLLDRNLDGTGHEKLHIEDIRRSLQQYLNDLQSKGFDTEEDCMRRSELEASLFGRHMNDWKKQSNLERHPELRRASR